MERVSPLTTYWVGNPDLPTPPLADLNLVTLESLRALGREAFSPEVPDIEASLRYAIQGDYDGLVTRTSVYGCLHLSPGALVLPYAWLVFNDLQYLFIENHPAIGSAAENRQVLACYQEEIAARFGTDQISEPIKSVTLGFKGEGVHRHVLVVGIGDYKLGKPEKTAIAEAFGFSRTAVVKRSTVNPVDFDTALRLGNAAGIVGPLFPAHLRGSVSGVCYLQDGGSALQLTSLAVTPMDSLVLRRQEAETIIGAYYSDSGIFNVVPVPFAP